MSDSDDVLHDGPYGILTFYTLVSEVIPSAREEVKANISTAIDTVSLPQIQAIIHTITG